MHCVALLWVPLNGDHFQTSHVGSLPRPPGIAQVLREVRDGAVVDEDRRRDLSHAALETIVERQRTVGLDVINDGEVNKTAFSEYIFERVSGFGGESVPFVAADLLDFPTFNEQVQSGAEGAGRVNLLSCIGPVEHVSREPLNAELAAFETVVGALDPDTMFMGAVTPGQVTFNFPNEHYPSHEAYLFAVADALKPEYDAIAAAGLTLQLDSPDSAMAGHCRTDGSDVGDHQRHLAMAIEALNHALADIPPERLRFHVCWGNYVGPHHRDIELKDILPTVLAARPMTISFEGANPRHEHEWEVFEELALPDDKMIMPGVIDTKSSFIEHPRLVAQRIERFANLVGKERVMVAPDCGFSTYAGVTSVDSEIAWAKLASMVQGAAIASDRCF